MTGRHQRFFAYLRNALIIFLTSSLLQPVFAEQQDPFKSLQSLGNDLGMGGGGGADDILTEDQAFMLSTSAENGHVIARWDIAEGHYLYRDKIKIIPDASSVTAGELKQPEGELKHDEFFGEIYVYHHQAEASLPISEIKPGVSNASFKVKYQGCSEISGICYPPITKEVSIDLSLIGSASAAPSAATSAPTAPVSEQDRIADSLKSGSTWLTIISFFGFGLLLAFTPCVFPMIPILSSIIVGQGSQLTTRKAFWLSLIYVLAMAATYTVAGVVAGLFGENLQAAFQNPWILSSFAAVFVLLSLSMFGFYDLQMPSFIQSRLTEISNRQQGGTYAGVAIMGFLSALIVGPCVAAPLAGALIYIGQTGDAMLGGLALFALSMGMGAPLIAIGTSAGKILPRAGMWMDAVKAVFGVMLLGVAIWMLERILPASITLALWAILFIVSSIYMGALEGLKAESTGWTKFWKGLGLILFTYGILLLIGASAGSKDMLQPLKGLAVAGAGSTATASSEHLNFQKIKGLDGLNQALASAQAQGKPVMLDFYADWCISCKEMEKYTFSDASVQTALANTVLLKADVTDNDAQDKELYKHFGIIGPPAIIFYDAQGKEVRSHRVVGFMPAAQFSNHVTQAIQ
ncbi:MAG: protein-disulfide reductase DsbD [Gammaproteobacteria bacterium]|nr:MAG: protein-disulfide reductase DsbD [Gammaproteobacteria bacterium]